jgi:hypothetical protein
MHQIIGGFILGAAFGQSTRKVVWRPLLRSVIKGGIVVAREASSMTAAMQEEAKALYAEASEELNAREATQAEEEPAKPRKRSAKKPEV